MCKKRGLPRLLGSKDLHYLALDGNDVADAIRGVGRNGRGGRGGRLAVVAGAEGGGGGRVAVGGDAAVDGAASRGVLARCEDAVGGEGGANEGKEGD